MILSICSQGLERLPMTCPSSLPVASACLDARCHGAVRITDSDVFLHPYTISWASYEVADFQCEVPPSLLCSWVPADCSSSLPEGSVLVSAVIAARLKEEEPRFVLSASWSWECHSSQASSLQK